MAGWYVSPGCSSIRFVGVWYVKVARAGGGRRASATTM